MRTLSKFFATSLFVVSVVLTTLTLTVSVSAQAGSTPFSRAHARAQARANNPAVIERNQQLARRIARTELYFSSVQTDRQDPDTLWVFAKDEDGNRFELAFSIKHSSRDRADKLRRLAPGDSLPRLIYRAAGKEDPLAGVFTEEYMKYLAIE